MAAGDIRARGKKAKLGGCKLITKESISKAEGKRDRQCAQFGFPTNPNPTFGGAPGHIPGAACLREQPQPAPAAQLLHTRLSVPWGGGGDLFWVH